MTEARSNLPTIGVFDSGFGGLTVLRALIALAPQARYAFIGDTARLPYGSKSRRTIARYAAQSARFLVEEQGADYLVIACNTASALALDDIKEAVPSVPVIGVIEPGAEAAHRASKTKDVLVIATDATVQSHAYAAACQIHGLRALEKACPLLVPLVEEGWVAASSLNQPLAVQAEPATPQVAVTAEVVRIYLEELSAEAAAQGLNPDTLVLGCTHYPLLKPVIERILPAGTRIIDSAESTASKLVMYLSRDLGAPPEHASADPILRFFATDSVEKFERLGSRFLGRPVGNVQLVDLGG
ncbi:MAG: glutamate racemase [Terracidiphilus sp.]